MQHEIKTIVIGIFWESWTFNTVNLKRLTVHVFKCYLKKKKSEFTIKQIHINIWQMIKRNTPPFWRRLWPLDMFVRSNKFRKRPDESQLKTTSPSAYSKICRRNKTMRLQPYWKTYSTWYGNCFNRSVVFKMVQIKWGIGNLVWWQYNSYRLCLNFRCVRA